MDPPKHDEQRKVVSPIVAPQNLAEMEATIRERTRRVLDGLPVGETFDWVEKVSIELTTMMLATLFDFPWEERRQLTYWSDVAIANVNAPDAPVHSEEERFAELKKMAETMAALFNHRAKEPPKFDLLSMLAHGAATREMPLREFMGNLTLLIVGGNDTTRNSMTGGLLALSQNPDQYQELRQNPDLVASMVPEIIRYVTPVIHMRRTAKADAELGGKAIRKGDKVVMWYVSGNRDPTRSTTPTSSSSIGRGRASICRSVLASTAASAIASPNYSCVFCGRRSCHATRSSRWSARRGGPIRISSTASDRCRCGYRHGINHAADSV
jgi:cytochrome P450